jgi:hypothetical protein
MGEVNTMGDSCLAYKQTGPYFENTIVTRWHFVTNCQRSTKSVLERNGIHFPISTS